MSTLQKTLQIRTSPHILSSMSVDVIMRNVVFALIPVVAFAIYAFGFTALILLTVSTLSCVLAEHLLCLATKKESTIGDWSAVITGLLYGLTLPPGLPLWMVASGGFVAIGLGKFLFGGLGSNMFNPALIGRAVLQAAFPVAMTTWVPAFTADRFATILSSSLTFPFATPEFQAITSATPLGAMKFDGQMTDSFELAMGLIGGSTGETSSILILLGGAYLASRKMLNWRIPISIFAAVAIFSGIFHWINPDQYAGPIFMLFSGGLMLGAVFMATDMVASPMTTPGIIIYGGLIGILVVVIRFWGGLPEGVMYAILFGNACSPLIDRAIQPTVYGTRKQREAK
jgi:electron transport complex protein RnfD